jgi:hypothetical protein
MNGVTRGRRRVEEKDRNCLCPAERALCPFVSTLTKPRQLRAFRYHNRTEEEEEEEVGHAAQMKKDHNTCTDCSLPPPRSLARSSICVFAQPEASTQ